MELQKLGEADEEKLFVEAGKALLAEGVILRRTGQAKTQQEGSHVSWKSAQGDGKPHAASGDSQPVKKVPPEQAVPAPGEPSTGPSAS